jgi:hypothetical protein
MRCSDAAPGRVRLLSRLPSDSRIGAFSVINVIQKLSTKSSAGTPRARLP